MYIVGYSDDPANRTEEADDDLPSIEELLRQLSGKGISTGGYQNSKDTLQYLEEPALSSIQSTLDGVGDSHGMRVSSPSLYIKQSPDYTQIDQ